MSVCCPGVALVPLENDPLEIRAQLLPQVKNIAPTFCFAEYHSQIVCLTWYLASHPGLTLYRGIEGSCLHALVIALVPLKFSSISLKFPHRVPLTEKMPCSPCPFRNGAYWSGNLILVSIILLCLLFLMKQLYEIWRVL